MTDSNDRIVLGNITKNVAEKIGRFLEDMKNIPDVLEETSAALQEPSLKPFPQYINSFKHAYKEKVGFKVIKGNHEHLPIYVANQIGANFFPKLLRYIISSIASTHKEFSPKDSGIIPPVIAISNMEYDVHHNPERLQKLFQKFDIYDSEYNLQDVESYNIGMCYDFAGTEYRVRIVLGFPNCIIFHGDIHYIRKGNESEGDFIPYVFPNNHEEDLEEGYKVFRGGEPIASQNIFLNFLGIEYLRVLINEVFPTENPQDIEKWPSDESKLSTEIEHIYTRYRNYLLSRKSEFEERIKQTLLSPANLIAGFLYNAGFRLSEEN